MFALDGSYLFLSVVLKRLQRFVSQGCHKAPNWRQGRAGTVCLPVPEAEVWVRVMETALKSLVQALVWICDGVFSPSLMVFLLCLFVFVSKTFLFIRALVPWIKGLFYSSMTSSLLYSSMTPSLLYSSMIAFLLYSSMTSSFI